MPRRLRAPFGPTLWIAALPGLERLQISQLFLCTSSDGFAPRFGHFPLNFAEDAHTKNMSTFEADEHLRGCKAGPGTYWYAESAAKVLG